MMVVGDMNSLTCTAVMRSSEAIIDSRSAVEKAEVVSEGNMRYKRSVLKHELAGSPSQRCCIHHKMHEDLVDDSELQRAFMVDCEDCGI